MNKQAEALHKEIDSILKGMQCKIKIMDSKHLAAIDQQETQINQSVYKITKVILDLQNLLDSNNAILISENTSRIEEFKNFPPHFHVILPTFIPQDIKREQIYQQFGILSKLFITQPGRLLITKPSQRETAMVLQESEGWCQHRLLISSNSLQI